MTKREKNRWLDQRIKTGIPGIWWTERYKKYYAKFKSQILGEFDTEDQAIKFLAKTIRSSKSFPTYDIKCILKKIEAYEIYNKHKKIIALPAAS